MRPKIWLGLLSFTRLSVTACALGCTKFTLAALPMLKVFQLTTARWLVWFTVMAAACAVAVCVMVAVPRATLPPVGSWLMAGGDCAFAAPVSEKLNATEAITPPADDLLFLPAVFAVSGTACQDCVATDQRVR
jgi:hypothetical protein